MEDRARAIVRALVGLVCVVVILVAAWSLAPFVTRGDSSLMDRTMSKANLHWISLAIFQYRAEHDDQFPPDLAALRGEPYIADDDRFLDPADESPAQLGDTGARCSYEYVGPIPDDAPFFVVICYTRKGIHAGGRNVLYNDMAVEWVSEADLQRPDGNRRASLRASYDAVVKAFGDQLTEQRRAELKKFYEIED